MPFLTTPRRSFSSLIASTRSLMKFWKRRRVWASPWFESRFEALAEWSCRTIRRQLPPRPDRLCRRFERSPSETPHGRIRGLSSRRPHTSRAGQRDSGSPPALGHSRLAPRYRLCAEARRLAPSSRSRRLKNQLSHSLKNFEITRSRASASLNTRDCRFPVTQNHALCDAHRSGVAAYDTFEEPFGRSGIGPDEDLARHSYRIDTSYQSLAIEDSELALRNEAIHRFRDSAGRSPEQSGESSKALELGCSPF